MYWMSLFLGGILILTIIDLDVATKNHRDRGGHRREHESLLDKQERERDKDKKKENREKKEEIRNITCYKCDGDVCRDPFQSDHGIPSVQCEHSCWKGVFASSVRRACGNKRCGLTFQGSAAISNTCCETSFCNKTSTKIPSLMFILYSFLILIIIIK